MYRALSFCLMLYLIEVGVALNFKTMPCASFVSCSPSAGVLPPALPPKALPNAVPASRSVSIEVVVEVEGLCPAKGFIMASLVVDFKSKAWTQFCLLHHWAPWRWEGRIPWVILSFLPYSITFSFCYTKSRDYGLLPNFLSSCDGGLVHA